MHKNYTPIHYGGCTPDSFTLYQTIYLCCTTPLYARESSLIVAIATWQIFLLPCNYKPTESGIYIVALMVIYYCSYIMTKHHNMTCSQVMLSLATSEVILWLVAMVNLYWCKSSTNLVIINCIFEGFHSCI